MKIFFNEAWQIYVSPLKIVMQTRFEYSQEPICVLVSQASTAKLPFAVFDKRSHFILSGFHYGNTLFYVVCDTV